MIDEKKLIAEIKDAINDDRYKGYKPVAVLYELWDMITEQPKVDKWIPFTIGEDGLLNCKLPEEDEEILVSGGGSVWEDTFMTDGEDYWLAGVEE